VPDELTGQAINAIVSLKNNHMTETIERDLVVQIRTTIGPFAAPKKVLIVQDLPKTRSGKIVRRILRKMLTGETEFGDTSTASHAPGALY
jgi:acetyl-CoA synthetase